MRAAFAVAFAFTFAACGDNTPPGCTTDADCGDPSCASRTCANAACIVHPFAAGAMASIQTPGDCKLATCDGKGDTVAMVDDSDLPTTSGPGFTASCRNGTPSTPYAHAA